MRGSCWVAVVVLVGCSSNEAKECPAGTVLQAEDCRRLCASDLDCDDATVCSDDAVCRPGSREHAPVILGVNGDGTTDGATDHTANRLSRRVIIDGQHFTGAGATLSNGGNTWELEVCDRSDNQLTVELPDGITRGEHVLSVVSQAGACNATLPLLEGEQGALPMIGSQRGILGDGSPSSPLEVDFDAVAAGHLARRHLEAENTRASGLVGAAAAAGDASGGLHWISTANGPTGILWSMSQSDLGTPLAAERASFELSLRVASNADATPIAEVRCETLAELTDTWATDATLASIPIVLAPDDFSAANGWENFTVDCDLSDTDADQRVVVELLDASVTTLAIDALRIMPGNDHLYVGSMTLSGVDPATGTHYFDANVRGTRYPGLVATLYGDNTGHPTLFLKHYRGTPNAVESTLSGDNIGVVTFFGHDATANAGDGASIQAARIVVVAASDFATAPASGVRYPMDMVFQAGTNATCCGDARMVIRGSDGFVGIGTTSPGFRLDVNGQIASSDGLVQTSDARLKSHIQPIHGALDRVSALRGVSFTWKDPKRGESRRLGLIAQEVEPHFPEVVYTDTEGYKALDYSKLVSVLVEAVGELNKRNRRLESSLREAQGRMQALESDLGKRIERLEGLVKRIER